MKPNTGETWRTSDGYLVHILDTGNSGMTFAILDDNSIADGRVYYFNKDGYDRDMDVKLEFRTKLPMVTEEL